MKQLFLFIAMASALGCYGADLDRSSFYYCHVFHSGAAMREHLKQLEGTEAHALAAKTYAQAFAPHLLLKDLSPTDPEALSLMGRALRHALEKDDAKAARDILTQAQSLNPVAVIVLTKTFDQCQLSLPEDMVFWKVPNDDGESKKAVGEEAHLLYSESVGREVKENMRLEPFGRGTLSLVNKATTLHLFDFNLTPDRREEAFVLVKNDLSHGLVLLRRPNDKDAQHSHQWHFYLFALQPDVTPLARLLSNAEGGDHDILKRVEWDAEAKRYNITFLDYIPNEGWTETTQSIDLGQ